MKKALLKFWSQHTALAIGAVVSFTLLTIFLLFQHKESSVLKLESRWLLVSGVPLLAALIVGGYIKSVKGLGVELEANLSKPVTNTSIELSATEAMDKVYGDEKRGLSYLRNLGQKGRNNISRLVLVQGPENRYETSALKTYLQDLPNLEYIEIRNKQDRFIALLPIRREFKHDNDIDDDSLTNLINALQESRILRSYPSRSLITTCITEDTGLIEALEIMRRDRKRCLVVVNENGEFQGLLKAYSVEKRIAEYVLSAKGNT